MSTLSTIGHNYSTLTIMSTPCNVPNMFGYTKLFESIVTSTIWQEDLSTKVVWITMLALKNQQHMVEASVPGLAHVAGVTLEQCQAALDKLQSPDPYSRSAESEGRRIEARPGGWLIINGQKYQAMLNAEERREYKRGKQAEYRQRQKQDIPSGANLRTETKRQVDNDPITKADEAEMRRKWGSGEKEKPEYAGDDQEPEYPQP